MSDLVWHRALTGLVLFASLQAAAQSPKIVAFANVSVMPMTENRVLPNQTVVITGDRITAVGPAKTTPVPEGATRVDGQGKYLMPGLAEMHGHIPAADRPARARGQRAVPLRRQRRHHRARHAGRPRPARPARGVEAGRDRRAEPLPRRPAVQRQLRQVAEDAASSVRQQKSEGWDLLKVQEGLSPTGVRRDGEDREGSRHPLRRPRAGRGRICCTRIEMGQETFDHIDGYVEQLDGRAKPVDDKALPDLVTDEAGRRVDRADDGGVGDAAGAGHARVAERAAGAEVPAGGAGRAVDQGARRAAQGTRNTTPSRRSCTSTTG